jgi:hypothetical protein
VRGVQCPHVSQSSLDTESPAMKKVDPENELELFRTQVGFLRAGRGRLAGPPADPNTRQGYLPKFLDMNKVEDERPP